MEHKQFRHDANHSRMYEAIALSHIIICNLTGQWPNAYVEAGYALKHHESNRLIFLFEPTLAGYRNAVARRLDHPGQTQPPP